MRLDFSANKIPEQEGLYFIGLIQPLGALMPLSEIQRKWIADLVKGAIKKPAKATMLQTIDNYVNKRSKRYTNKPRHTVQVAFWPYKALVEKEIKKRRV